MDGTSYLYPTLSPPLSAYGGNGKGVNKFTFDLQRFESEQLYIIKKNDNKLYTRCCW